jgi:hypothetical protein
MPAYTKCHVGLFFLCCIEWTQLSTYSVFLLLLYLIN